MRRFSTITIAAVSLLMAAAVTVPAALADSEAQLQASSSASAQPSSAAESLNDTNGTLSAGIPLDTTNVKVREILPTAAEAKRWGMGPTWGGPSVPAGWSSLSITPQKTAKSMPVLAPHIQTPALHPSNTQLAARPVYSFTSRKVIHSGTSANSRHTYIKKQIRQAEVSM